MLGTTCEVAVGCKTLFEVDSTWSMPSVFRCESATNEVSTTLALVGKGVGVAVGRMVVGEGVGLGLVVAAVGANEGFRVGCPVGTKLGWVVKLYLKIELTEPLNLEDPCTEEILPSSTKV